MTERKPAINIAKDTKQKVAVAATLEGITEVEYLERVLSQHFESIGFNIDGLKEGLYNAKSKTGKKKRSTGTRNR